MEEDDPGEFFTSSKPTEPETTESSKFPMNESSLTSVSIEMVSVYWPSSVDKIRFAMCQKIWTVQGFIGSKEQKSIFIYMWSG